MKRVDLAKTFPLFRRPFAEAARAGLARWRDHLGMPLNAQPKFASGGDLASRWIIAVLETDTIAALDFAGAVMRARRVEERDIADADTLAQCASTNGIDSAVIATRANAPEITARYAALTQEAVDRQVFGAPRYVVDSEPFWGQDRLDFVARKLAQ